MQDNPPSSPKPKHDHAKLIFPEGFLWGAATSAFQVEGNNIYSDWWQWEQKSQPEEKRSGEAGDQYNLYEQDFDLAKSLRHNAHRLSIEWSRIEPEEGKFNQNEIDHYKKVLQYLKNRGFVVMLTLWHFTTPNWLAQKGGWENKETVKYFLQFINRVVPELSEWVDLWITLNEPFGYTYDAYTRGKFPPQKKNLWSTFKVLWNFTQAHKKAYYQIHKLVPNAKVGLSHSTASFSAFHSHDLLEQVTVWIYDLAQNHLVYILTGKKTHDFLGLNYYFNNYVSFNENRRIPQLVDISVTKKDISDMGWEIFPQGMFNIIMDFSDYHLPIYITENGIASSNDDRRVRFLLSYLQEIYHATQTGADVRGYFHWSLLDNYEWIEGKDARFGLVEVDFKTQKRSPRPSARIYQEIIKNNGIPHYLLKLLGHGLNVQEEIKKWPKTT